MDPWMAMLMELVRAGVCVAAAPQMLQGHKVQVVTCATTGIGLEATPLPPAGKLNPMRPDLRSKS
ncbi:MAG: hypothetical protein NVSMB20_05280 [Bradyrhizobium sp.]